MAMVVMCASRSSYPSPQRRLGSRFRSPCCRQKRDARLRRHDGKRGVQLPDRSRWRWWSCVHPVPLVRHPSAGWGPAFVPRVAARSGMPAFAGMTARGDKKFRTVPDGDGGHVCVPFLLSVTPAQAGVPLSFPVAAVQSGMPTFAGMTARRDHKSKIVRCGSSRFSFTRTRKVTASLPSTMRWS